MCAAAQASHIASCLSVADILAVLYADVLRYDPLIPHWPDRDRLILSKGHAAAALYAVLAECGFFPPQLLASYCQDESALTGHVSHAVPGVEVSTGSLGHGLAIGCGIALAALRDRRPSRVFVVLSDGELDEGSTWEAALLAGHHRLHPLTAIIDYNKIQSFGAVAEVLNLEPLAEKWRSFGWHVREVDGHDPGALTQALQPQNTSDLPTCVIAHTIKGRGVSFMEGQLAWHYRSPSPEQLTAALAELER
jgi:transketolase